MREILYRGKAINRDEGITEQYKNGDWVYGLITRLYDDRPSAEMTDVNEVSRTEVDYKTVGQFTGSYDKNNKKIFEGDVGVVKTKSCEFIGFVEFSIEYARYVWRTKSGAIYPMDYKFEYEIIGDIYDTFWWKYVDIRMVIHNEMPYMLEQPLQLRYL